MFRRCRLLAASPLITALLLAGTAVSAADPPPLPLHTLEGYGGGAITPMAYLVNPTPIPGTCIGRPAAAISFADMNSKSVTAVTVTETLFERVELGYSAIHCTLGSLPSAIRDFTGIDPRASGAWVHNFNVRFMALKENDYELLGVGLPAVTAGFHLKYNDTIAAVNSRLGGALSALGYRRPNSIDYTLTASKTVPKVFGRPLITSVGLRLSEAAELGLLGFGDDYTASVECNVAYFLCKRVVGLYEFRQKNDPYGTIPGLINGEDNWNVLAVAFLLDEHASLATGWGNFGTLCNEEAPGVWLIQLKYEF